MAKQTGKQAAGLKIEKGIPIPARGGGIAQAMRQMAIGDSALLPGMSERRMQNAYGTATRLGIKIATRKVDGGYRIWRVA